MENLFLRNKNKFVTCEVIHLKLSAMKIRAFFTFALLLGGVALFAQDRSSARSQGQVYLDFKSLPATITWVEPAEVGTTVKEKILNLKVGIEAENEILSAVIYVNDVPLEARLGFKKTNSLADRFDKFIDREITLTDGVNNIKLVVTNADGTMVEQSISVMKEVDVVASLENNRKDYALVFGTNEYSEWDPLTNPVFDAETIAEELKDNYGFEVDVVLNATKAEMEQKLVALYDRSYQENDQLLIFFAGHGNFDERTTRGFIVASDSKLSDPTGSSYLSYSNLRDLVDNVNCKHTMLMLDACFGGTFDQNIARAGSRGHDNADMASRTEFIERKLKFQTRMYVTSGGKEYVRDGRPGHHSPFAKQFLAALRDYGGADGILTKSELRSYMEVLSQQPRMGDFGQYEPGSDFIFIAK
jgi:hypothetical protein